VKIHRVDQCPVDIEDDSLYQVQLQKKGHAVGMAVVVFDARY
jgi:hypothetical protein